MMRTDLILDDRFVDHESRKQNEDALDDIVREWTATADKWDLADQMQAIGIAAAPVEHLADTFGRDPQLGDHYQEVRQPSRPEVAIPVNREAAQWVGHELKLTRAPSTGEHNHEVVCKILGYSQDEYIELLLNEVLS